MMNLEQGDLVLCTVERIEGTIVFVKVNFENKEMEGSIVTSEIAPGRIRNIRDYVVPKKKIVCKVLRISGTGNIELSLRRVSPKEKKDVMDKYRREMAYSSILKKILGEKSSEVIEKIRMESANNIFVSEAPDGIRVIKKILGADFNAKIFYIGSGRYSIKTESSEIKKADASLREILGKVEKSARENKADFSIREK